MRTYTERYNAARQAGAKPLILAEVWTDRGPRVYGKQTPPVACVSDEVFEWGARVLNFGDFRQSVSENPDSVTESIVEKAMDAYTLTLDNADGLFSRLFAREQYMSKKLVLYQGYDYPGFEYDDLIVLFAGRMSSYKFGHLTFELTADQSIETKQAEDPTVTITKTYSLTVDGTGNTGAEDTFTYTELETTFFTETSWTETFEVLLDSGGESELLAVRNTGFGKVRWAVGIDSSGYLYLEYTDDMDTATPTYKTLTSNILMGSGGYTITIDFDVDAGLVIFSDGNGNTDSVALPLADPTYDSQFGSSGTGTGEFDSPRSIAVDSLGNMYVSDDGLGIPVQKFDSDGNYLLTIGTGTTGSGNGQFNTPRGIAIDQDDNIWVADAGNDRVQGFNSLGVYQRQFGTSGSGNGELSNPYDVGIDSLGYLWVMDSGNDRVQKFNSTGGYLGQFGSAGTGDGQFDRARYLHVDGDDNIWVADIRADRVQKFNNVGTFLLKFGTTGSGNGQLNTPRDIGHDASGQIYVVDSNNQRVQIFTAAGVYADQFGSSGSGNGQFQYPDGIAVVSDGLYVVDAVNYRVQFFSMGVVLPDFSDNGSDDDLVIADDLDGTVFSVTHNEDFTLLNEFNNTETFFEDQKGLLDVDLVDGYWEEWGTVETITSIIEEETEITAFEEIYPPTAGNYTNPGNNQQNLILPLPYGDLTENSDTGVYVCPCIDTVNYVYGAAGWAVLSVANGNSVTVYVDGIATASGWTFDESNDYEGQGNIATLTFTSDQGDSVISVRMKGKDDGAGTLLTNPIDIIADWMDYVTALVGTAAWQKDETSFAKALADATAYGYTCAGVIQANNSLGFWLQSILNSFLGTFRFDNEGKLQVSLEPPTADVSVQEWLDEYEQLDLYVSGNTANIINRLVINYAISYTEIDRRFKNGGESSYFRTLDESNAASRTRNGERSKQFDFDWTRNTATVEAIQDVLFDRFAEPELLVSYQGQDFKYMPLELGDDIQAQISFVLDNDGAVLAALPYRLREKTQNLDDFTTTMLMQSIGYFEALNA